MSDKQLIPTWVVFLGTATIFMAWGNDPASPVLAFVAGVEIALASVFLYLKHLLRRLVWEGR